MLLDPSIGTVAKDRLRGCSAWDSTQVTHGDRAQLGRGLRPLRFDPGVERGYAIEAEPDGPKSLPNERAG